MADVFLPQKPILPVGSPIDYDRIDPNLPRSSSLNCPLPNPPFVFPMQPEPDDDNASERVGPTLHDNSNRRTKARSRPQQLSFDALPDFSFNPSLSTNDTHDSETPSSPSKSQMCPPHHGGHRRNGSEFIGGDGKDALSGLMSTSPTKGEGALPPPPGARTGPPAGRRGHAHRRSGAISSHDVSTISKPTIEVRGSSAPATPSDPFVQPNLPTVLDRSMSQPANLLLSENSPHASHHRQASSSNSHTRPRVGFSDHVEFIPRPLSTISSETSSSLSTVRPCHSVTGSISSIISAGNTSPPSAKSARMLAVDLAGMEEVAATTSSPMCSPASGTSELPPTEHFASVPEASRAAAEPAYSSRSLMWSDVLKSPCSELDPENGKVYHENPSLSRLVGSTDAVRNRRRPSSSITSPIVRPRTSPEPKVSKRQRKVKSWADSILVRRARHSLHESALHDLGSPTSQTSSNTPVDLSLESLNFDVDTTCVIDTAPRTIESSTGDMDHPILNTTENSPKPEVEEPDQLLDLDAVYAPSSLSPKFEEVTGTRNAGARRRFHSSGVTGGFDSPGMHYHRRAESAPELAPVNRHMFGMARLGSNSTMEDVFEEDEEDEAVRAEHSLKAQKTAASGMGYGDECHGLGIAVSDVPNDTENSTSRSHGSNATCDIKEDCSDTTRAINSDELRAIEVVSAEEEPREPLVTKSANGTSYTTMLADDPLIARPLSAPMQYMLPTPSSAFANPEIYSSAVSTPDFSHTSFEGPRLHTASSSITDRGTLSSFRAGDESFDFRASVDDVPSLTSSASTMTNAYPPRVSSSVHTRTSADRPPSLSTVIVPRTRPENASKRSSLASLSRLVGGSHGERSKLNIEERAQPEDNEKSEKKRGKRISRLMRFWKGKEKVGSS